MKIIYKDVEYMQMMDVEKIRRFARVMTLGRDNSHGYEHLRKVYVNSMRICTNLCKGSREIPVDTLKWVTIVAWLHDVADHKYDHDGKLADQVKEFIRELDSQNADHLWTCIECVSFSREKREGAKYYENILPVKFIEVRNIVSDADKLEALGVIGLERCEEYTRHAAIEKNETLTELAVIERIMIHCKEKLFILATGYMRTNPGYKMAIKRDTEMKEWLEKRFVDS
jgi:uncharacterized protein